MTRLPRDENREVTIGAISSVDSESIVILEADPTNKALNVTITSESAQTTLVAFVTDVPTAGTRVQLADNTIVAGVLQAPSTNTGNVYIGGSNVSSTVFGAELQPGQATGIAISNTNKIYIDAATSGDDVAFIGS
jgi:hypothetical protein